MNDGFDFGIIVLGLGALAFIAGIVGWVVEFLANRVIQTHKEKPDESGPTVALHQPLNRPIPQSAIKHPVIPAKELFTPSIPTPPREAEKPKVPPFQGLEFPKASVIQSSPPSAPKTEKHQYERTRSYPPESSHKKEYKGKINEYTPEAPRPVKNQAPLPEYGGMCSKCGENPKVPGNDGFCKECSPLD